MHKSRRLSIETKSIGNIAIEVLAEDQAASVISSISRGIYIKSSSRWLVFISHEGFRSPLTITLKEAIPLRNPIQAGSAVNFTSGQLLIPEVGITITTDASNVWKPAPRQKFSEDNAERKKRLNYFTEKIMLRKPGAGFSPLLPGLLKLPDEKQAISDALAPKYENIIQLQRAIQAGKLPTIGKILCDFLGFGEGLTPSGDDFVLGVLLCLNRWKDVLSPDEDLGSLNQLVVDTAYQATTTLSANLIECAALGEGDERLIKVIDFLMCGGLQKDEIATDLLNWGSSSGVDAFVGMATAATGMDADQTVEF